MTWRKLGSNGNDLIFKSDARDHLDSRYIAALLQYKASTKIQTRKLAPSDVSKLCALGEADARPCGVVNGVIVLKELLADDEVDVSRATIVDPGIVESRSEPEMRAVGEHTMKIGLRRWG